MPAAPFGCKSLIELAGQKVIGWQRAALPDDADVTVVCKPRVSRKFDDYDVTVVTHELSDGPVCALRSALNDEPCVVIFSDTLFDAIPQWWHETWVGVGLARGGRVWELTNDNGFVRRKHVSLGRTLAVHCGIYHFQDPDRLADACHEHTQWDRMLNRLTVLREEPVAGWIDVGDEEALAAAEDYLNGDI
jgi:hypothetical protein